MHRPESWPTREEVEQHWLAVLNAHETREQAHAWAIPWVETSPDAHCSDLMVGFGLTHLHGFDMTHDPEAPDVVGHGPPTPPRVYAQSLGTLRADFEQWRRHCADYDRDPAGWQRQRMAAARAWAVQERRRPAADAAGEGG